MKILARGDESPDYWESTPDLDEAVPCFCGSNAAVIGFRTPNVRLVCQNRRCGRTTSPGARLQDAIEQWNKDVREDSCAKHTWLAVDGRPGVVRCQFCDCEKNLGSARA